jgi:hypothetical protein
MQSARHCQTETDDKTENSRENVCHQQALTLPPWHRRKYQIFFRYKSCSWLRDRLTRVSCNIWCCRESGVILIWLREFLVCNAGPGALATGVLGWWQLLLVYGWWETMRRYIGGDQEEPNQDAFINSNYDEWEMRSFYVTKCLTLLLMGVQRSRSSSNTVFLHCVNSKFTKKHVFRL